MPDLQGNIEEDKSRKLMIIEYIEKDLMMVASIQVIIIESKSVDHVFEGSAYYDHNDGT